MRIVFPPAVRCNGKRVAEASGVRTACCETLNRAMNRSTTTINEQAWVTISGSLVLGLVFPVVLSEAETFRIPLASMSKVTSI
jgi:hypothetical protein